MGNCLFPVAHGQECGVPAEGNEVWCLFHRQMAPGKQGSITGPDLVKEYVRMSPHTDAVYLTGVTFERIVFGADIVAAIQRKGLKLIFDGSTFANCTFTESPFQMGATFVSCRFKDTSFDDVDISCDALDFSRSVFHGPKSIFRRCNLKLTDRLDFSDTTVDVPGSPFDVVSIRTHLLDLQNASIRSDWLAIRFSDMAGDIYDPRYLVVCADKVCFSGLKFDGHLECTCGSPIPNEAAFIDFSVINFSQMRSATFINMNLEKARFLYSVTESIRFVNVRWPEQDDRRIIYDEIKPAGKTVLDDLRWEYNQLKKNYEAHNDYVRAGQWFYRETEVRRRMAGESLKKHWQRRPNVGTAIRHPWLACKFTLALLNRVTTVSLYGPYRWISNYGENYPRALLLLVMLWAGCGVFYFYNGFIYTEQSVSYNFAWTISGASVVDFLKALAISAAIMAFQAGRAIEIPTDDWSASIYVLQLLLTLVLVPLFLLALRRKFRR